MEIDERLDNLSKQARVAAACAGLEHTLDLYRKGNFRFVVGAHATTLKADEDDDLVDVALQLAWSFVEHGRPPDGAALKAIDDGTSGEPDDLDREEMSFPSLEVLDALESLMNAIQDPTPEAAANALENCRSAVHDLIQESEDGGVAKGEEGYAQELAWQERLLARVEQNAHRPISRATFADLIAQALPWRAYLDAYEDN